MTATHDWYAVVAHGEAAHTQYEDPPHGPWHGAEAAHDALARWRDRLGPEAGTASKAMNVRVAGPYCTREEARKAHITDGPKAKCRHQMENR